MRRALLAAVLAVTGCTRAPVQPTHVVDAQGRRPGAPPALPPLPDVLLEGGGGRVRLLGADVPARVRRGAKARVTLAFLVERAPVPGTPGSDAKVFVHAAAPQAELNQAQSDHAPAGGTIAPSAWRPGDVVVDAFDLAIPAALAVDTLVVRAGLYEGKERWEASPDAAGDDRVDVGRITVEGAPATEAKADIPKRTGAIVVDGVPDEPDWQRAPELPFFAYDGRSAVTRGTTARMLWDEEALYVAFHVEDPDPFTVYTKRDDPLYESEATELFIDADGDGDAYVELQGAFNDVQFDAAFAGGRRKNMDRDWNATYETRTRPGAPGWTSEWRVDVASLKDIPDGEPRAGATWRVNLFRLERIRRGDKVVRTEASAWSPPLSGDFHHLARFGVIRFVDGAPPDGGP